MYSHFLLLPFIQGPQTKDASSYSSDSEESMDSDDDHRSLVSLASHDHELQIATPPAACP